jgi:hypothetical protein
MDFFRWITLKGGLVLESFSLLPCSSTGPKKFRAGGPSFLSQSKNLIAFIASSKTFLLAQKQNLCNGNHLLV